MKIFIAGIMQGSKQEASLHEQSYRRELKNALQMEMSDAEIYDPYECNKNSLLYSPETGRQVFLNHNRMCGSEIDILIAFIPEASMGSAIDIWEAWKNGAFVVIISPLKENWVVKFLSDVLYPSLSDFYAALKSGEIRKLVERQPPRTFQRSAKSPDPFTSNSMN